MSIPRRGLCLVVAAPSGAGKSSITRALLASEPDLLLSVSVTTRAPRAGEEARQIGGGDVKRNQDSIDALLCEVGVHRLRRAHVDDGVGDDAEKAGASGHEHGVCHSGPFFLHHGRHTPR